MRVQRFIPYLLLVLLFSLSILGAQAQETNLLTNPGFENGFRIVSGRANPQVANGWEPWFAVGGNAPEYQLSPYYIPSTAANSAGIIPRVRTGNASQIYYSWLYESHDAGIYQRVTGIPSGAELRFSVYGYVFSNNLSDLDVSEEPGNVAFRVGIDPTGGTDPFASTVIYNEALFAYDAFREYNVIAKAQGTAVTVFVRTTVSEPVQNTVIYLDDAVLNVTPESQPQASNTPTTRPTNTTVPTNTPRPTNTNVPASTATNTARPTNTVAPTNTTASSGGDATPTREVVATNTTAPNNTAIVPTATIAASATATNTRVAATSVAGFPGTIRHVVRRGDTVGGIAVRYGSSIEAIIEVNELNEDAFILAGQELIIPIRVVPATETPSPTPLVTSTATQISSGGTTGNVYVVQRGDTLTNLAIRYGTTINTLVQLNGITNPNNIFVGQRLQLPSGTGAPVPTATPQPLPTATSGGVIPTPTRTGTNPNSGQTYVVQPYDSLYRLSIRFNVSIVALARANNITNYNYIQIGQVLVIP
jgi:LysM repeat protein